MKVTLLFVLGFLLSMSQITSATLTLVPAYLTKAFNIPENETLPHLFHVFDVTTDQMSGVTVTLTGNGKVFMDPAGAINDGPVAQSPEQSGTFSCKLLVTSVPANDAMFQIIAVVVDGNDAKSMVFTFNIDGRSQGAFVSLNTWLLTALVIKFFVGI